MLVRLPKPSQNKAAPTITINPAIPKVPMVEVRTEEALLVLEAEDPDPVCVVLPLAEGLLFKRSAS
jgi:hypothetical protein